jgi:hypothetical protein
VGDLTQPSLIDQAAGPRWTLSCAGPAHFLRTPAQA